jgi:hypothetical protein
MKEFFEKYKKIILIVLIIILLLLISGGVYYFFFYDKGEDVSNDTQTESLNDDTEVDPEPEYDERSSKEAILATYTEAKAWSSDVVLYDCTGMTMSSVKLPSVTYYFLGHDEGKYAQWLCTYYSKSKGMTTIIGYDEGEVEGDDEPMDTGEYGYLLYDAVEYPSDLTAIVDSTDVYSVAVDNGLDLENNYCNMYLTDTSDYGFVWKVDERSKTEKDEYDTGLLINSYIVDIYDGDLVVKSTEDIY